MNYYLACKLLNIKELNKTNLKQKYYKACLKCHPDKTKGTSAEFIKITEAYEYLKKFDSYENNKNQKESEIIEYIKQIIKALLFYFNPIYELNPTLKHLMNREVYFLKEYSLYIPLWHECIIFNNITVNIVPILPPNIYIDMDNNIHIFLENITDFEIGGVSFSIHPLNKLKMVELKGKGIPRINNNIYDFSVLSDIVVHFKTSS